MKVLETYNHNRRDCSCNLECEKCGFIMKNKKAYDDNNFWKNIVPGFNCVKCGESTKTLGEEAIKILTRFPEGMTI